MCQNGSRQFHDFRCSFMRLAAASKSNRLRRWMLSDNCNNATRPTHFCLRATIFVFVTLGIHDSLSDFIQTNGAVKL